MNPNASLRDTLPGMPAACPPSSGPTSSATQRSMVAVKVTTHRDIKTLAKEALDVQDACNLSGVIHAFSRAITDLREIARTEGWESTNKINRHPICILYSDKIASLTTSDGGFSYAYNWAKDLVEGKIRASESGDEGCNE